MKHARATIDCEARASGFAAAYLRTAGDECAFVECYTNAAVPVLLETLAAAGRRPEDVRYVVVTHAHLDHAGGASGLMAACPNATLLAHPRAARHLIDPAKLVASAKHVYGEARFTELYGVIAPIPEARVRVMEDGATFTLGDATLTTLHTAGHAKHHFVVHDPATSTVYTGDTFGLVYPHLQRAGTFAFASTTPTDFDAAEALKSLDRVLALGEPSVCPTHYGEARDVHRIADQVRRFVELSEQWVAQAAATAAPLSELTGTIQARLREALDTAARRVGLSLGPSDWAALELDVTLNAQGLAFVADKRRAG
ncbi:MAG: MBL fold metallo-hydrolase [Myxococcales bacterium]|mgnify:CR=1 FL=1|nr:MBL fold metallo-hydrolase [Myxococcales bacterium]MBL0198065.1 MBL fold metallo-hydrolase [Myxococcales bacterium]HQY64203.1 MBL fold metallo-hydrolase [Polyangiaceae bacterium]